METFRNHGVVCLLLLLIAIVGLKGDEEHRNVNAPSKGRATFVTLSNSSQGINEEGKQKQDNSYNKDVKVSSYNRGGGGSGGGGGGGGGGGWDGGGGGGWGWGWGGGGGGWWKWGCGGKPRHGKRKGEGKGISHYSNPYPYKVEDYIVEQFAQCMRKTRCKGMRLDCPLHCGGACYYDCHHMCKAHCRRP